MNLDVINEHYYGDPTEPTTERARKRIHWICNQATGHDVLDIGCSQGIVCLILGREGYSCTGIDIESASLAVAEQALAKEDAIVRQRVCLQLADATKLPFPDESFDTVVLGEIIEHLVHPEKVLAQAKRVLRNGGQLIVTVPYGLNAFPDHKRAYYPISLLELLQPLFSTGNIETLDNYIVYTGKKDPGYDAAGVSREALFDQYRPLEKALEERCLAKEQVLLETATKLYAQIRNLTAQAEEKNKRINALEENLAAKDSQTRNLQTSVEQSRVSIGELRDEGTRARAEVEAHSTIIKDLEQKVQAKDGRIHELETSAEKRQVSITELIQRSTQAETASTIQAAMRKEIQESIVEKEKRIKQLETNLETERASSIALYERVIHAEAASTNQSTRIKEIQEVVAVKESRLRELEHDLEKARASITALEKRVTHAEAASTLQANTTNQVQETVIAKENRIKELEIYLEKANTSNTGLRERTIRAELESTSQKSKLKELRYSITTKIRRIRSLERAIEKERQETAAAGKQLAEAESNQRRLKEESQRAVAALASLEQKVGALQSENNKYRDEATAKTASGQQQIARMETLHLSRLKERDKQHEEQLARREAELKRKQVNQKMRDIARLALPVDARVLVISKGDDDLLNLDGRYGQHFPQTAGGVYAGYHPADATQAISHLEALKAKGAQFLLIPSSSFWWLEFYKDFRTHLESRYRLLIYNEDCLIFSLSLAPQSNRSIKLSFEATPGNSVKSGTDTKSNGHSAASVPATPTVPQLASVAQTARAATPSIEHKTITTPASLPMGSATPSPARCSVSLAEPSRAVSSITTVTPPDSPVQPPNEKLTVGCVLDEFTAACFGPECNLVSFRPDNWKATLEASRLDMLFVESAWRGNDGAWQYKIVSVPKGNELVDLINYCRSKHITTVFWNKEDPVHFDRFIKSASLFDYVFTTDSDCVARYNEHLQHDRTFALPFAAQSAIHNPVLETERLHNVCFAGAYYGASHDERRRDMDLILKPALGYGLHIFDRQHGMVGPSADQYRFPEIYQPAIKGYLKYDQLVRAYKRYRVFLNVNSVKTSPTMFSRRVFELLACGTPIISAYARGIENLLGSDVVAFADSETETKKHLDRLLGDEMEWARASTRGIRAVFEQHTYGQRWQTLCQKVLTKHSSPPPKIVTIIAVVNREEALRRVVDVLTRQTYRHFRVLLHLGKGLGTALVEQLLKTLPDIQVKVLPDTVDVAFSCANVEVGDYLWLIQSSDFYGANFLKDCILAANYSDAEFIGKHSHFILSKDRTKLELTSRGYEYKYVSSLPPGSFLAKRGSLTEQAWRNVLRPQTLQVTQRRVLSIDPFNYVRNAYLPGDKQTDGLPILKQALV